MFLWLSTETKARQPQCSDGQHHSVIESWNLDQDPTSVLQQLLWALGHTSNSKSKSSCAELSDLLLLHRHSSSTSSSSSLWLFLSSPTPPPRPHFTLPPFTSPPWGAELLAALELCYTDFLLYRFFFFFYHFLAAHSLQLPPSSFLLTVLFLVVSSHIFWWLCYAWNVVFALHSAHLDVWMSFLLHFPLIHCSIRTFSCVKTPWTVSNVHSFHTIDHCYCYSWLWL